MRESGDIIPISYSFRPSANGAAGTKEKGEKMAFQERRMVDVRHLDLHCAECGKKLEELPFMPSSDRPVYCADCNKKRRPPRQGGRSGGRGRY